MSVRILKHFRVSFLVLVIETYLGEFSFILCVVGIPTLTQHDDGDIPAHDSTVSYTIGLAGTGQPSISYPLLEFHPAAFYALGSPTGE